MMQVEHALQFKKAVKLECALQFKKAVKLECNMNFNLQKCLMRGNLRDPCFKHRRKEWYCIILITNQRNDMCLACAIGSVR